MKKNINIIIAAMMIITATAFVAAKSKPVTNTPVATENKIWFNTIQIADGITVEFEYGPQLRVYVEGDTALIKQMALVLENNVLKATGKNCLVPVKDIRIKVVTPVLISLARNPQNTPASCSAEQLISQSQEPAIIVAPVLKQEKIFQVFTAHT